MMDHRDDWPDGLLEADLDSAEDLEPSARQSAERMARDERNMDAVLTAMAQRMSERMLEVENVKTAPPRRRLVWRWTLGPIAAAAATAVLILVGGEDVEQGRESVTFPASPAAPSMVSEMNVEADGPFVVFPTSDPDIAVVWLLNPKESD